MVHNLPPQTFLHSWRWATHLVQVSEQQGQEARVCGSHRHCHLPQWEGECMQALHLQGSQAPQSHWCPLTMLPSCRNVCHSCVRTLLGTVGAHLDLALGHQACSQHDG